ncbi:MAG: Gfo/Idh/MocA family protein [Planctomycetota bacterium]
MIRIGLIGAGGNGRGHLRKFASMPERCRIVAVADPQTALATEAAEPYGARACADFHDFLDTVELVVISSPNWLHPEHAIACAEAGKHILIEKPMALSTADADRMVAACDAAGVVSMVGFSVRFEGTARTLTERYRAGELGDLVSIFSRRMTCFKKDRPGSWRMDYDKSGGVMSELMVHEIDWMVDAVGMPDDLVCRKASRLDDDPRANEHVWLQMAFGRATGTIEGSQMSHLPDMTKGIIGRDAAIGTREWGKEVWITDGAGRCDQVDPLPRFDKHTHILDAIAGTTASVADVHHGRAITALAERAIRSAVEERPIDCRDLQTDLPLQTGGGSARS